MTRRRVDQALILDTAAELAEEDGADRITIHRLAEKLGIRPPSLYNHLSGLEGLSEDLAKFALQKLDDALRSSAVGKAREEALLDIARSYRRFARDNPELYKAIFKAPTGEGNETREAHRAVSRTLHQVMESYRLGEEDTVHFVRAFRSALHGFISLEQAGFFKAPFDTDTSFERTISGLISTLPPHGEKAVQA